MAALKYFSLIIPASLSCWCWGFFVTYGWWLGSGFPEGQWRSTGEINSGLGVTPLLLHTGLLLTPQSSEGASLPLGRHLIITSCGVPLTYSVVGRVLVSSLEKVSICVPHLDFTEEGRSGPQFFFFYSPWYLAGVKCFFLNSFCLSRSPFPGLLNKAIRLSLFCFFLGLCPLKYFQVVSFSFFNSKCGKYEATRNLGSALLCDSFSLEIHLPSMVHIHIS